MENEKLSPIEIIKVISDTVKPIIEYEVDIKIHSQNKKEKTSHTNYTRVFAGNNPLLSRNSAFEYVKNLLEIIEKNVELGIFQFSSQEEIKANHYKNCIRWNYSVKCFCKEKCFEIYGFTKGRDLYLNLQEEYSLYKSLNIPINSAHTYEYENKIVGKNTILWNKIHFNLFSRDEECIQYLKNNNRLNMFSKIISKFRNNLKKLKGYTL